MTSWLPRTLIVPSEQVEFARNLIVSIAGTSGANMLTTALSQNTEPPAVFWISGGLIGKEFADLLPLTEYSAGDGNVRTTGQPAICAHLATVAGNPTTSEQVSALFAVAQVTDEEPRAAMARMGMQIIINESDL